MAKYKLLLVEDEQDIAELLIHHFIKEGYDVRHVSTGEAVFEMSQQWMPDLILLDLMLPGKNGVEVFRQLKGRSDMQHVPVIMLTARSGEADVVNGLSMGVDDYVTKPFSPKVLVARVKNTLARHQNAQPATPDVLTIGGLSVDLARREVRLDNTLADLTFSEFQTLALLAARPGRVYSRYQIVEAIRGDQYEVTDRAVDVMIVGLRKKLGEYAAYIETVRGVGYRMRDVV